MKQVNRMHNKCIFITAYYNTNNPRLIKGKVLAMGGEPAVLSRATWSQHVPGFDYRYRRGRRGWGGFSGRIIDHCRRSRRLSRDYDQELRFADSRRRSFVPAEAFDASSVESQRIAGCRGGFELGGFSSVRRGTADRGFDGGYLRQQDRGDGGQTAAGRGQAIDCVQRAHHRNSGKDRGNIKSQEHCGAGASGRVVWNRPRKHAVGNTQEVWEKGGERARGQRPGIPGGAGFRQEQSPGHGTETRPGNNGRWRQVAGRWQ